MFGRRGRKSATGSDRAPVVRNSNAQRPPPLRCEVCQERFGALDDLQVHQLTVHSSISSSSNSNNATHDQQQPPLYGEFQFRLAPVDLRVCATASRCGRFRGIQGENNSCFLDASLFAMFFAECLFDVVLLPAPRPAAADLDADAKRYAQQFLQVHIVNNLRRRGFVPAALVVEWRRMIAAWFCARVDFDSFCAEEEACEFVAFLLNTYAPPSLRIVLRPASLEPTAAVDVERDGTFMLQLLSPSDAAAAAPALTVEQLLTSTLQQQQLQFAVTSESLILQLPRYGKKARVVGAVVVEPRMHVSDASGNTHCFELVSLLAIGVSHFVAYARIARSDGTAAQWVFFDSMCDRINDVNVPEVVDVSAELAVLETPAALQVAPRRLAEAGRHELPHLRRVVMDAACVFYRRVSSESPPPPQPSSRSPHAPDVDELPIGNLQLQNTT